MTYETTTKRVRVTAAPVLEGVPGGQGRRCRAGPVSFPRGAAGPREGGCHAGSLRGVTRIVWWVSPLHWREKTRARHDSKRYGK